MTLDEYQDEAIKTRHMDADLVYLSGKLAVEAVEVFQPILKNKYHGKALDKDHVLEECGDCLWYIANIAASFGVSLDEIAEYNVRKLRTRHGVTYNPAFYKKLE